MSLDHGQAGVSERPARLDPLSAEALSNAALGLARCFEVGGTLWCWSPRWPEHAAHVAVEFVHPVVVGTRALPAIAVDDPDPVAALRAVVRPGDAVLAVGDAAAAGRPADAVLRRASTWGATTLWLGAGEGGDAADHRVRLGGDPERAAHDGTVVCAYHVLWELTHVCLEHPAAVAGRPAPAPAAATAGDAEVCGPDDPTCITCSDDAQLAEVVGPQSATDGDDDSDGTLVRCRGRVEAVDTTLVDPVEAGELVLVHAGVAISRLEEDQ